MAGKLFSKVKTPQPSSAKEWTGQEVFTNIALQMFLSGCQLLQVSFSCLLLILLLYLFLLHKYNKEGKLLTRANKNCSDQCAGGRWRRLSAFGERRSESSIQDLLLHLHHRVSGSKSTETVKKQLSSVEDNRNEANTKIPNVSIFLFSNIPLPVWKGYADLFQTPLCHCPTWHSMFNIPKTCTYKPLALRAVEHSVCSTAQQEIFMKKKSSFARKYRNKSRHLYQCDGHSSN